MSASKYRTSCDACLDAKVKCSQSKPSCGRCNQGGQACTYSQYRRLGRPPKRPAPDVPSHQPGDGGARSSNRRASPRPRSQPTNETHMIEERIRQSKVMYQANIRPKTGEHRLTSDNEDTSAHHNSTHVLHPASAHEWPQEDLVATEEDSLGSFDLMPEFDLFDNLELQETDFLPPSPGLGLPPSIASPARLSTKDIIGSRFPMETITDVGQQSLPALALGSLESAHDSYYLLPAAPQTTAPGAQETSTTPSMLDARCQIRCYTSLMEQMSRLGDIRSSWSSIPFDVILSQEKDVRRQRETILSCPSCMGAPRSRQTTLLPLIMVLESLIRLFELGGDGDRCCCYQYGDIYSACSNHMGIGGGEPPPTPTSPGDIVRQQQRQRDHGWQAPRLHMPQTRQPVLVGHFEVDEPAKAAFLRQLLRLHLERHLVTVSELGERLATGPKDVNYKVAREILADTRRRIEHFQGYLASTC